MTKKIEVPEYKSEVGVSASQMRKLSDVNLLILKVFKPYRHGWDDNARKYRSFYYFPARLTQDVVYSGSEEAKIQDGDTFVLREKFWDDEAKKFGFRKIMFDGQFFKTFRKVFDVDVSPESAATFKVWDSGTKQEIEIVMDKGNTFTLKAVPSSRIIGMLEALDLDAGVELIDGKDKTGNPIKVRPFDFEDSLAGELAGRFIKFKVRGEGMDTRYSFKEGNEFSLFDNAPTKAKEPIDVEDLPFK